MATSNQPGVAALDRRRGFLTKTIALAVGAVAYLAPAAAGIRAFLNPLRQKGSAGRSFRLASLGELDAVPRKFAIVADRVDAWNRFPNEPVGAVYLRRREDGQVEAHQVVCPHAGCSVQFDAAEGRFLCPCHLASYDISGKRLGETSPAPRDMDRLEVEIRDQDQVWVQFANFRTGTPEKIPEA